MPSTKRGIRPVHRRGPAARHHRLSRRQSTYPRLVTPVLQQTRVSVTVVPGGSRASDGDHGVWRLVTGAMLLTWLPHIGLPLGDSHEGRILARLGMQAANVWRLGLVGSRWGTSLEPYDPNGFYAHHPPLINILHVIAAGMLGGDQPWHLRIPGYLAGLATLVAVALLLRALELGWAPTLLAVGAMAATPMFWIYGRLGAGFSVLAGFAAIVAHLRRVERPGRGVAATAATLAALTVLLSWPGVIGGALLGAWLWRRRGLDGITRLVLEGWCCGALLLVVWLAGSGGGADLVTRASDRIAAIDPAGFVERQWWFATELFTWWWLLLVIPALVAGFGDRRTRVPRRHHGIPFRPLDSRAHRCLLHPRLLEPHVSPPSRPRYRRSRRHGHERGSLVDGP